MRKRGSKGTGVVKDTASANVYCCEFDDARSGYVAAQFLRVCTTRHDADRGRPRAHADTDTDDHDDTTPNGQSAEWCDFYSRDGRSANYTLFSRGRCGGRLDSSGTQKGYRFDAAPVVKIYVRQAGDN